MSLCKEIITNVATVTSLPAEPTPPVSLLATSKPTESFKPKPTSSMCYVWATKIVIVSVDSGHNLIFCRKVMALKKPILLLIIVATTTIENRIIIEM